MTTTRNHRPGPRFDTTDYVNATFGALVVGIMAAIHGRVYDWTGWHTLAAIVSVVSTIIVIIAYCAARRRHQHNPLFHE